jgi:hypothetical protein
MLVHGIIEKKLVSYRASVAHLLIPYLIQLALRPFRADDSRYAQASHAHLRSTIWSFRPLALPVVRLLGHLPVVLALSLIPTFAIATSSPGFSNALYNVLIFPFTDTTYSDE